MVTVYRNFVASLCMTVALVSLYVLNTVNGEGELFYKTCQHDSTNEIRHDRGVKFEDCLISCSRRRKCQAVMYARILGLCSLLDDLDVTTLSDTAPLCIYSPIDDWRLQLLPLNRHCSIDTCASNERCEPVVEFPYIRCVKAECPRPRDITNAFPMSSQRTIGTRNIYRCERGYYPATGSASVTCRSDATWSDVSFGCTKYCRHPHDVYDNAYVASSAQVLYKDGDVVEAYCKPEYHSKVTNATCGSDGNWSPRKMPCCPSGLVELGNNQCYLQVNLTGLSYSYDDMIDHCKNLGCFMVDPWPVTRRAIATAAGIEFTYMWFKRTKNNTMPNIIGCLDGHYEIADNGTVSASSNPTCDDRSFYQPGVTTYNQLVNHIRDCNIKKPWNKCADVYRWVNTEPNLDTEHCMFGKVSDNMFGYMYDVPCSGFNMPNSGFLCRRFI